MKKLASVIMACSVSITCLADQGGQIADPDTDLHILSFERGRLQREDMNLQLDVGGFMDSRGGAGLSLDGSFDFNLGLIGKNDNYGNYAFIHFNPALDVSLRLNPDGESPSVRRHNLEGVELGFLTGQIFDDHYSHEIGVLRASLQSKKDGGTELNGVNLKFFPYSVHVAGRPMASEEFQVELAAKIELIRVLLGEAKFLGHPNNVAAFNPKIEACLSLQKGGDIFPDPREQRECKRYLDDPRDQYDFDPRRDKEKVVAYKKELQSCKKEHPTPSASDVDFRLSYCAKLASTLSGVNDNYADANIAHSHSIAISEILDTPFKLSASFKDSYSYGSSVVNNPDRNRVTNDRRVYEGTVSIGAYY